MSLIYNIDEKSLALPMDALISIDRRTAIAGIAKKQYRKNKDRLNLIGTTTMREIYAEDLEENDKALMIDESCYEIYDHYPCSFTMGYLPVSSTELVRVASRLPLLIITAAILMVLLISYSVSNHVTQQEKIFSNINSAQFTTAEDTIADAKSANDDVLIVLSEYKAFTG